VCVCACACVCVCVCAHARARTRARALQHPWPSVCKMCGVQKYVCVCWLDVCSLAGFGVGCFVRNRKIAEFVNLCVGVCVKVYGLCR